MANPPPMLPGLGFPVDSEIDLLRKWTWNTWLWAQEDFQPEDIPGLGLDLDASYGVLNSIGPDVPATNGQSVRRWLDKSGNGRYFDQSTATQQPAFSAAGFGGASCVSFDAVDDFLQLSAGFGLLNNIGGLSCFIVANFKDTVGSSARFLMQAYQNSGVSGAIYGAYRYSNDGGFVINARRLPTDAGAIALLLADYNQNRFITSSVADFQGAIMTAYYNGTPTVIDPFQTAGNTAAVDIQRMTVGGRILPNPQISNANIARVLVWPRTLTASELAQVHAYLSQTYGIAIA